MDYLTWDGGYFNILGQVSMPEWPLINDMTLYKLLNLSDNHCNFCKNINSTCESQIVPVKTYLVNDNSSKNGPL